MTYLLYIAFAPGSDAPAQAQAVEQYLTEHGHNFTHPIPYVILIAAADGVGADDVAHAIVSMLVPGFHLIIAEVTDNRVII